MKGNKGLFIGIIVVVIVVAGVLVAATHGAKKTPEASSSSSSSSTKPDDTALSNAVATNTATIQDFKFSPAVIKVKVGDTVTWTNKDSVGHSVVADTASADAPNGPLMQQGETYQFTFNKAGTFTLHCNPHTYMHQVVEVTN
jgi:amicyanin